MITKAEITSIAWKAVKLLIEQPWRYCSCTELELGRFRFSPSVAFREIYKGDTSQCNQPMSWCLKSHISSQLRSPKGLVKASFAIDKPLYVFTFFRRCRFHSVEEVDQNAFALNASFWTVDRSLRALVVFGFLALEVVFSLMPLVCCWLNISECQHIVPLEGNTSTFSVASQSEYKHLIHILKIGGKHLVTFESTCIRFLWLELYKVDIKCFSMIMNTVFPNKLQSTISRWLGYIITQVSVLSSEVSTTWFFLHLWILRPEYIVTLDCLLALCCRWDDGWIEAGFFTYLENIATAEANPGTLIILIQESLNSVFPAR